MYLLMNKFTPVYIILIVGVLLIVSYVGYNLIFTPAEVDEPFGISNSVQISDNSGCCIKPPCQECFEQQGFCDCQQREEAGLEACEECEASESCDQQSDVCEIDLE